MTSRSMPFGGLPTDFRQSSMWIGAAVLGLFFSHIRQERCRSLSASAVFNPAFANADAKFVAMVVLPQPPLTLATRTDIKLFALGFSLTPKRFCPGKLPPRTPHVWLCRQQVMIVPSFDQRRAERRIGVAGR